MNDVPGELRRISRFTLRGLLFAVMACAIEASAFIYSSPFWWLMSVVVLASLVGVSAHRLSHINSARRAARIAIIVIGGIGFVHLAMARHPWTGSWLLRLNYDEATAGNGWFAVYGAARVGIFYTLCWTAAATVAGCAVGLAVATKNRKRRQ